MKIEIIKNGKYLLAISIVLLIISIISILLLGLKFGIDFTGGTQLTYPPNAITHNISTTQVLKGVSSKKYFPITVHRSANSSLVLTTVPLSVNDLRNLETIVTGNIGSNVVPSVQSIGPVIGDELKKNALYSVLIASAAIIIYIAYAFRKVSHPLSSWSYGVCAVLAMMHDVIIVFGAFAILGYFFNAPVDSLFVTAILTVIGFSVHDTIVVFDRIRENQDRLKTTDFKQIINISLIETLSRSINTSLTVLLTLLSLFLLGGDSIRWFVLALLIGISSGTYSSIFVASQLIVVLYDFKSRSKSK